MVLFLGIVPLWKDFGLAAEAKKTYSLADVQGVWWDSCDDPAAAFGISGDRYFGDFDFGDYVGELKISISGNVLRFESGFPVGHSVDVSGQPFSALIISVTANELILRPLKNRDGGDWILKSCKTA
jgi:hypothetical protein